MRPKFAVGFRSWCVAVALCLATAHAAESPHPLMGASREQVLSRNGEPKSQLAAGNREVLFYPGERLVLRNGVVVEVEPVAAELPRSRTPESPQAAANESRSSTGGADAPPEVASDVPAETTEASSVATPEAEPPPAEPKLEIKRVLPPSASSVRPAPKAPAPVRSTPAPGAASAGSGSTTTRSPAPESKVASSAAEPAAAATRAVERAEQVSETSATDGSEGAPAEPEISQPDSTPPGVEDAARAAGTDQAAIRRIEPANVEIDALEATASAFTARTYIIAFLTIAGGIAYLVWRSRQRLLLLAATAVSRTPFSPPATVAGGTIFDAGFLSSLEWKRFEELVASYYSKTGVIASRTKGGPNAPVHIKISWKGEPRPFALVQCIAHPTGLIDAKPLQELFNVLTAEDIRRGYVVTTGKFNVPARDFAEEKHITLLPGDIFLEKLNALPDAARAELMQEITAGDYTTPSCPKCDAKMSRSPDDSGMWRCATHPEESIPIRR